MPPEGKKTAASASTPVARPPRQSYPSPGLSPIAGNMTPVARRVSGLRKEARMFPEAASSSPHSSSPLARTSLSESRLSMARGDASFSSPQTLRTVYESPGSASGRPGSASGRQKTIPFLNPPRNILSIYHDPSNLEFLKELLQDQTQFEEEEDAQDRTHIYSKEELPENFSTIIGLIDEIRDFKGKGAQEQTYEKDLDLTLNENLQRLVSLREKEVVSSPSRRSTLSPAKPPLQIHLTPTANTAANTAGVYKDFFKVDSLASESRKLQSLIRETKNKRELELAIATEIAAIIERTKNPQTSTSKKRFDARMYFVLNYAKECLGKILAKIPENTHIPFPLQKYFLTSICDIVLNQITYLGGIKDTIDATEKFYRKEASSQQGGGASREIFELRLRSFNDTIDYILEVYLKQINKFLFNQGALDPALSNPATTKFVSKFGIRVIEDDELLSEDQTDTLREIDQAISKTIKFVSGQGLGDRSGGQTGAGKAEVRLATGAGKSHLMRVIKDKYAQLSVDGIRYNLRVENLDLNSSQEQVEALLKSDSKYQQGSQQITLLNLDELFFESDKFFEILGSAHQGPPQSIDQYLELEKAKSNFIRKLRLNGTVVVSWGASESIAKIDDAEILRMDYKKQEIELKIQEIETVDRQLAESEEQRENFDKYKKIVKGLADLGRASERSAAWDSKKFSLAVHFFSRQPGFKDRFCEKLSKDKATRPVITLDDARKIFESFLGNDYDSSLNNGDVRKKFLRFFYEQVEETSAQLNLAASQDEASAREKKKASLNEKLRELSQKKSFREELSSDLKRRRDQLSKALFDYSQKKQSRATSDSNLSELITEETFGSKLKHGEKAQYILPDYALTEEKCTAAHASEIMRVTSAQILIIPVIDGEGASRKLKTKVFSVGVEPQILDENELKRFLEREDNAQKSILSVFAGNGRQGPDAPVNAIGGDYGNAGVNVSRQFLHLFNPLRDQTLTTNRFMQYYGRDRTAGRRDPEKVREFGCEYCFVSNEADLGALFGKVQSQTTDDDEMRRRAYLMVKAGIREDDLTKLDDEGGIGISEDKLEEVLARPHILGEEYKTREERLRDILILVDPQKLRQLLEESGGKLKIKAEHVCISSAEEKKAVTEEITVIKDQLVTNFRKYLRISNRNKFDEKLAGRENNDFDAIEDFFSDPDCNFPHDTEDESGQNFKQKLQTQWERFKDLLPRDEDTLRALKEKKAQIDELLIDSDKIFKSYSKHFLREMDKGIKKFVLEINGRTERLGKGIERLGSGIKELNTGIERHKASPSVLGASAAQLDQSPRAAGAATPPQ